MKHFKRILSPEKVVEARKDFEKLSEFVRVCEPGVSAPRNKYKVRVTFCTRCGGRPVEKFRIYY